MTITFNVDRSYNGPGFVMQANSLFQANSSVFFAFDNEKHLAVTKIFETVQGEMPFAGITSIFLRLAACNRGSKIDRGCYFCDTFFALNDSTQFYTFEKLADELIALAKTSASPLLVITGGEPMLQAPALNWLLPILAGSGEFQGIQFETNGDLFNTLPVKALLQTIKEINEAEFDLSDDEEYEPFVRIVISPKRTIREPLTGAFLGLASEPGVYVRLVVSGDPESVYYTIPQFLLDEWPNEAFYISPLTEYKRQPDDNEIVNIVDDIDLEATRRNIARAMYLAKHLGVRISFQSHSYIGFP